MERWAYCWSRWGLPIWSPRSLRSSWRSATARSSISAVRRMSSTSSGPSRPVRHPGPRRRRLIRNPRRLLRHPRPSRRPVPRPRSRISRSQRGQLPRKMPPHTAATAEPPRLSPAPVAAQESFEQRIGTRWVVWVGGVALALGRNFPRQLAVDQGYVGPKVRLTLAALLAGALVVAGEWARRSEANPGLSVSPVRMCRAS